MTSRDQPFDPPLQPLPALLPRGEPFTRAMALGVGVGRAEMERMLRAGVVRRLLRGVYVDASVAEDIGLRSRALGLVVGDGRIVVGATAGWLYGACDAPQRLDLATSRTRGLPARDVTSVRGLRVSTPLRTALDLARMLPPAAALAALDTLLRDGVLAHADLLAEGSRLHAVRGAAQARHLLGLADGRAANAAESALRLAWHQAPLPTPVPALEVGGLRIALGAPTDRFGATVGVEESVRLRARRHGWQVLELSSARVLQSAPAVLAAHLEREFRQWLLAEGCLSAG